MKLLASVLVLSSMVSAQSFEKVEYRYYLAGNTKTQRTSGTLALDATGVTFTTKKVMLAVPAAAISEVSYRPVRNVLLGLFKITKLQHNLTIRYTVTGTEKFANFELDSDTYHDVLAAAEAAFGKRVHRYPVVDPSP